VLNAVGNGYLGTTSGILQSATVTATFGSNHPFCILGGPPSPGTSATAEFVFDGMDMGPLTQTDSTLPHEELVCVTGVSTGAPTWSITLTTTSAEPLVLDGLVLDRGVLE
jgi:hypothetical protein